MTIRIHNLYVLEFFLSVVQRVLDTQVDEFFLFTFLWYMDGAPFNLQFHGVRGEDGARSRSEEVPNFRDSQMQEGSRLFVQFLFNLHRVALNDRSFDDLEVVHISKLSIHADAKDINVGKAEANHRALGGVFLECLQFLLAWLRLLNLQR